MSAGIDYGMGRTNINHETGIRYGVISQGAISQAWSDSSEPDYGDATCPKCEGRAMSYLGIHSSFEQYEEHGCADYACEDCELTIDSSDCFGDEAIGWNVDADGYKMTDCLDSDVMILESPYFTFAPYCSPCVPGAGNLDNASEGESDESNGVKTYCVGHDWFEEDCAPYPVYSVETSALIPPAPMCVAYGSYRHLIYAARGMDLQSYHLSFWIVPGTLQAD